jgi:hypothetical protein
MSAIEQQNAPVDEWECPVCYCSREEADGTVRPGCKHEVCLPCYSQVRDRDADPTCVLCRRPYWRRPAAAAPAPALDYDDYRYEAEWAAQEQETREARVARWAQERANDAAYLAALSEEEAAVVIAARRAEQRAPYARVVTVRVVRAPTTIPDLVARREARRERRKQYQPALSTLRYEQIMRLLRSPIVHETTGEVVPIAALRGQTQREIQARILGLRAATEAEQAASQALATARRETLGSAKVAGRAEATKTFGPSALPPTRRFRFGDIHTRTMAGGATVQGKCIGHHLWQYADGTRLRKGLPVGAPPAVAAPEPMA